MIKQNQNGVLEERRQCEIVVSLDFGFRARLRVMGRQNTRRGGTKAARTESLRPFAGRGTFEPKSQISHGQWRLGIHIPAETYISPVVQLFSALEQDLLSLMFLEYLIAMPGICQRQGMRHNGRDLIFIGLEASQSLVEDL